MKMDYEQPTHETYEEAMDEPVVNLQRQRDKRNLLLLGAFVLITFFGVMIYMFGGFKTEKPTSNNVLDNMSPPPPKNKAMETDKYKNFSREMSERGQPFEKTITALTEKRMTTLKRSNETLTDSDYSEVRNKARRNPYPISTGPGTKERLNRNFQQRNSTVQNRNRRYARSESPLFQKTEADLQAERRANEDRQLNQRTANLVLDQLEQSNRNYQDDVGNRPVNPSVNLETPLKSESADIQVNSRTNANQAKRTNAQLVPKTARNTIAKPGSRNQFYTLTTSVKKEYYTDSEAIPAVIHGDADGVKVSNGSTVKIRLIQPVTLLTDGGQLSLPKGELLTGQVRISGERVQIGIGTLRLQNSLYNISMVAYDLDGNQGLYIPDTKNKQLVGKALANTTTNTLNGGGFFTGGSIGQQVGTRVVTQGVQSALRGVQHIARQKISNPTVTIKSNYKILLKTGDFSL